MVFAYQGFGDPSGSETDVLGTRTGRFEGRYHGDRHASLIIYFDEEAPWTGFFFCG